MYQEVKGRAWHGIDRYRAKKQPPGMGGLRHFHEATKSYEGWVLSLNKWLWEFGMHGGSETWGQTVSFNEDGFHQGFKAWGVGFHESAAHQSFKPLKHLAYWGNSTLLTLVLAQNRLKDH